MISMYGLNKKELVLLKSLTTPSKIQDFLNSLKQNTEERGETCLSPRRVLREGHSHCMEGAMFAALALRLHNHQPLILDLTSTKHDFDHVVAVFQQHQCWGAISKTNHGVLRYREPVYRTIRELALSYFHEYFLDNGKKTLRSYSSPVNLSRFDSLGWITSEEDVWEIPEHLALIPHIPILSKSQIRTLRPADAIEIKMGRITEW